MFATRRLGIFILVLALGPLCGSVRADQVQAKMQDWLTATQNQGTIAPGTSITMQNWQQYKQYMPLGMIDLFEGTYFWKMASDVQMPVGPTVIHPLSASYQEASEKYGAQTRRWCTIPTAP